MKLRKIDIKICELLGENYSQTQIAEQEGVSKQYVNERVKFLEVNNILAKKTEFIVHNSLYVVNFDEFKKHL